MSFTEGDPFPGDSSISTTRFSDEELIEAIVDGADWALEQLYRRYNVLLYSLVYRMVDDHQVAEDLLQEAFLALWRQARSYAPQAGAVRSWMVAIVHHRTIDYLRTVRRRSRHLPQAHWEEAEQDEGAVAPDVWQEVWGSVQRTQVRRALMELSIEQRLVIELAYFQGWTHTEIAEGCHLPLGTVKSRIRSGLMQLKRVLEAMGLTEC